MTRSLVTLDRMMPLRFLVTLSVLLFAATARAGTITVRAGAEARNVEVLAPRADRPLPLVILLHGRFGTGAQILREAGIRPGAFIRGNVIAGENCVLGNSCEFKNCLLLDGVQAAHFNYVGDSLLGNGAHLGAGVICSNLRLDQGEVTVRLPGGTVGTGLKKFGAVIGDRAEIGCNAVLNPGSLIGPRALVMPCTAFRTLLAWVSTYRVAMSRTIPMLSIKRQASRPRA